MEVDGIRLDPNNYEFMQALAIGQATNHNLYLTAKALFHQWIESPDYMKSEYDHH